MPVTKKNGVLQNSFHDGTLSSSYEFLGAHKNDKKGKIAFRTYAPNAEAVYLAADFNGWKKNCLMNRETERGLWSIEVDSQLFDNSGLYKFIISHDGKDTFKCDPYAFYSEVTPKTASIVFDIGNYEWNDDEWLKFRKKNIKRPFELPINIYEVHLGSFKKKDDGSYFSYREIAPLIASYAKEMGYTHIELMPVLEHPFDGSYGYQASGYFSPTSRFGTPLDFKYFVDYVHSAGLGLILQMPMSNPAKDVHGLCGFDGEALYETEDGCFDISKKEVQSFVLSSVVFWLKEYHIDGIKTIDAEYMLDTEFFGKLSETVKEKFPDVLFIADETEGLRGVTKEVGSGPLFSHKLNKGWTADVLEYLTVDPMFRKHHHEKLTFSTMYSSSENYILPISHTDVVDGKRSLLDKSVGDYWQKFASTRAFMSYMMTHPGKKMLFMGCEIGQFKEWDYRSGVEWFLLDYEMHSKLQSFIRDLNFVYLENSALWQCDCDMCGFEWIDEDNRDWSLLSYIRYDKKKNAEVVIINLTPVGRYGYICGVPYGGEYRELINSDDLKYGGTGMVNHEYLVAEELASDGKPYSIKLDIGPYGAVILKNVNLEKLD